MSVLTCGGFGVLTAIGQAALKEDEQKLEAKMANIHPGMEAETVINALGDPDRTQTTEGLGYRSSTLYYGHYQLTFEYGRLDRINKW